MSVYAQEYGYFFNSNNNDRKYNAESFETWLKPFFVSGVFTGGLQVSAQSTPDMTVQVSAGYANLNGKLGYWNESNTLQLDTASGVYSRYDTIVLRRDNTNRRVSIEVVTGTASSNPQPTAPTRTGDVFELVLAEILVVAGATEITGSRITDKRPDTSVCGYVVAAVDTPDFTELYAQFTAQAQEYFGDQQEAFEDWFEHIRDQLDEDAAGHLQNEIDDLQQQIGTVPEGTDLQTEIDDAVDEIGRISDAMCYVVNGNKSIESVTIPVGHYFRLANSTVVGRSDGLYTAKIAIPAASADTAIDASYFYESVPISGGIAEALNNKLTSLFGTISTKYNTNQGNTKVDYVKIGRFVFLSLYIDKTINSWTLMTGMPIPIAETQFAAYNTNDNETVKYPIWITTEGNIQLKYGGPISYKGTVSGFYITQQ